ELLVVVLIIGILAAIAIPVFLSQRERAFVSAAESDARNAAIQVETFFTNTNTYPTTTPLTWGAGRNEVLDGTEVEAVITVGDGVELTYTFTAATATTDPSYTIAADHEGTGTGVDATWYSATGGFQTP
ncbi:MAG: hypothetical protein WD378_00840, partial [Egicoccus sp.]